MARPSFQIPPNSHTNSIYTFNTAAQFAGFGMIESRRVAQASTMTLIPAATGAYWALFSNTIGAGPGDSGGGLFATRTDLTRDTFGIISSGNATETDMADLTNPTMSSWILSRVVDAPSNHTTKWNNAHPPPVGYSDRWYGEVDYTGLCDTANDPDCDGWYSSVAKGQHDNCPYVYNPSQRDSSDRGFGDACPCPCDPEGDYDHDGKCAVVCPNQPLEADNCNHVWNPAQENCNVDAEIAHQQTVLGDACDPVPCPASAAVITSTAPCTGNPQVGGSCVGRNKSRRVDTRGIAGHAIYGDSKTNTFGTAAVPNVISSMRFCQSNLFLQYDCHAAAAINDSHLSDPEVLASAQPWHRVTQGTCTNGSCTPMVDDATGQTYSFNYDDTFSDTHGWDYALDYGVWTNPSLPRIPPPAAGQYDGCTDTTTYGTGTCLDGTWWSHAETPLGATQPSSNGVVVGLHGAQLANHFFDLRPDALVSFQYSGIGDWRRILLWRTLPDPWEGSFIKQTRYISSSSSGGQLGVLASDGTSVQVPYEAPSGAPAPIFSTTLRNTLQNVSNVWASAVEPMPSLGLIDRRIEGVALSSNGTQTVDVAMNDRGILRSRSELGFPDFVTRADVAHPSPRASFLSFYSSAAGGIFMMGGIDSLGAPMHDIWLRRIADDWGAVPLASDYTPDRIVASTFSFADQRLYVIDHTLAAVGSATDTLRLARVDIRTEAVETLATCGRNTSFPAHYLTVDKDGSILVTSTSSSGSKIGRLGVDANGFAYYTKIDVSEGPLDGAPVVDANGYSLFSRAPASNAILTTRKTQLAYGAAGSYPFCTLVNGGFETGSLAGWTGGGAAQSISPINHSGSYSATLGSAGITNGDSTISQTFTVPPGAGTLTFWYSNSCPDAVTYDWFVAELRSTAGTTLATVLPRTCAPTTAWTQVSFSLAPYVGQTVSLFLSSHDDNYPGDPTFTRVDDVALQ
ncbi:hypothetical protein BH09MYX1_BH09MYX1_10050 [soil metagenome]